MYISARGRSVRGVEEKKFKKVLLFSQIKEFYSVLAILRFNLQ